MTQFCEAPTGVSSNRPCNHRWTKTTNFWSQMDLGRQFEVPEVRIKGNYASSKWSKINGLEIYVGDTPVTGPGDRDAAKASNTKCGKISCSAGACRNNLVECTTSVRGRYVQIFKDGTADLTIGLFEPTVLCI